MGYRCQGPPRALDVNAKDVQTHACVCVPSEGPRRPRLHGGLPRPSAVSPWGPCAWGATRSPTGLLVSLVCRHLKEISELQSQQKQEIEALYRRLGKPLPANLGLFHTAPPAGRRRKASKSKLKAGRLLSPLVQQLKVVASSTGGPCALLAVRGRGAGLAAGGGEAGAPKPAWVGEKPPWVVARGEG